MKTYIPISKRDLEVTLHGPGPSDVSREVLDAMSSATIGHLDPRFTQIMDETQEMLREVFQTENKMTIPISGTGSAGMETLVANIIEPGDIVIVVKNGVFGARIISEIERHGAVPKIIDLKWGTSATLEDIEEAFGKYKADALFLVHAETSTGALQNYMAEISTIVHSHKALFLVDCVTSLGGCELQIDGWGIDAAYSGTQKCLSAPVGLSPITVNEIVMEKIQKRNRPVPSWYFDLSLIAQYWKDEKDVPRVYHHTAPINNIFGLHEALRQVLEEGLENRWERHTLNSMILTKELQSLGFEYIVENRMDRLPMLHAVRLPEGSDEGALRKKLLERHGIEVGGGLGEFKGKAWRIGIMGESCRKEKVSHLVDAIKDVLK